MKQRVINVCAAEKKYLGVGYLRVANVVPFSIAVENVKRRTGRFITNNAFHVEDKYI